MRGLGSARYTRRTTWVLRLTNQIIGAGSRLADSSPVVVVDDDEGSLDYFAMALRTYGAVVLTASNAVDALQLVRERRPDAVLSDIAMADHDGYWLVREIRGDAALQRIPVIATTAYGREHSRQRTLEAGFTEHLAKPVDPAILTVTIAKVTGRS